MIKCCLCSREAKFKDTKPIKRQGLERFIYYCENDKNNALAFGFAEPEDIKPIEAHYDKSNNS